MEKLRLGIIGMGNMGSGHLQNILDGHCPNITVTAFADINPEKLKRAKEKLSSAACFDNACAMLDSGLVDAALVAVPHYDHPTCALECFKRGIHVIIEKPAGVYVRQVREMNEAAKKSGVVFATMFNQRTNPLFIRAKEMLNHFADAILNGGKLVAGGEEGIRSLSISNAAYLSAWTNDWVKLPGDEALFEKYLKELCAKEERKKK